MQASLYEVKAVKGLVHPEVIVHIKQLEPEVHSGKLKEATPSATKINAMTRNPPKIMKGITVNLANTPSSPLCLASLGFRNDRDEMTSFALAPWSPAPRLLSFTLPPLERANSRPMARKRPGPGRGMVISGKKRERRRSRTLPRIDVGR